MEESVKYATNRDEKDKPLLSARACATTYVVFSIMFGVVALLAIVGMVMRPAIWRAFIEPLVIILAGYLVIVLWIRAFKVIVTETSITYRTLFSGSHSMLLSEIKKAKTAVGYKTKTERNRPFIRLEIISVHSHENPVIINLKVFDRKDVNQLLEILNVNDKRPRIMR